MTLRVLSDLHIASNYGRQPEKCCLPGTRSAVISEIKQWIHSTGEKSSKQIYWLDGPAGTGKSAIAHTIAEYCYDNQLLGCMFCFSTSVQGRNLEWLFPTISRDLASFDYEWAKLLVKVLQSSNDLCTTSSLKLQFEELLLKPAQNMEDHVVRPIVVVIDALDECGNDSAYDQLLPYITRLTELPSFFCFLITSRPEQSIANKLAALEESKHINHYDMARLNSTDTDEDICILVDHILPNGSITKICSEWNSSMTDQLVKAAEQSFQWTYTACTFIQGKGPLKGVRWHERFAAVLSASNEQYSDLKYNHLDNIYKTVLEQLFTADYLVNGFKLIVGCILALQKPVHLSTLKELYKVDKEQQWTVEILGNLGSLLYGVLQENMPIRPLHSSFREFLTNKNRSGPYFIDLDSGYYDNILACSTLQVMNSELKFNMCHLKTSYFLNEEDSNFHKQVQKCLSPGLIYSVQHWTEHLEHAKKYGASLQKEVKSFLQEKVLFWIESLSLLGQVHTVVPLLAIAKQWILNVSVEQSSMSIFSIISIGKL
jgi:hypothetical protein